MPGIETGNLGPGAGVFFVKGEGNKEDLFDLYMKPPRALYLAFKSAGFSDRVLPPFIFCSHPPSLASLLP